jgi:hypothetical protein
MSVPRRNKLTRRRKGKYETRLEQWMVAHDVGPVEFAHVTQKSRQWLTKLRWAKHASGPSVSLSTMKMVLWGARQLRGPLVEMTDLFDLEPDEEAIRKAQRKGHA